WYEDATGDWHPVDASEADKDPSRKEYFFGTICCNRVALSRGRDLVLEPPQAGEPLNFFIYPDVGGGGKGRDGGGGADHLLHLPVRRGGREGARRGRGEGLLVSGHLMQNPVRRRTR